MQRNPLDRYANASALAEDLRRFQTGKLVSAHRVHAVAARSQEARAASRRRRGRRDRERGRARRRWAWSHSRSKFLAERDIARGERARAGTARRSVEEQKRELILVQAETSLRKDPTAALAWLKGYQLTERDRFWHRSSMSSTKRSRSASLVTCSAPATGRSMQRSPRTATGSSSLSAMAACGPTM